METFPEVLNELSIYKYAGNLLSLHLSDLGLNFDKHASEDVQDMFQISNGVQELGGFFKTGNLQTGFQIFIDKMRGPKYFKEKADEIGYVSVLKHALNQSNIDVEGQHNTLKSMHM